jgi:hypothetical protein
MGAASQATLMKQISDLMSKIAEKEKITMDMTMKKQRTLLDDPPPLKSVITTMDESDPSTVSS